MNSDLVMNLKVVIWTFLFIECNKSELASNFNKLFSHKSHCTFNTTCALYISTINPQVSCLLTPFTNVLYHLSSNVISAVNQDAPA